MTAHQKTIYDEFEEKLSFRKNVTGVDNTISISPYVIRIAIDPDNLDPLNREVLLAYWNYKIDTDQLRQRLQSI